jgi:hypothetical protein
LVEKRVVVPVPLLMRAPAPESVLVKEKASLRLMMRVALLVTGPVESEPPRPVAASPIWRMPPLISVPPV